MKLLKKLLVPAIFLTTLFYFGCNKEDDPDPAPAQEGLQPSISSVSPSEGAILTELSIQGSNFEAGASVLVGTVQSDQVDVGTATQIFASVPAGIEANVPLSITVRNPGGKEATLEDAFTAIPPLISFINSATKPSGNIGSTVIIEGKAFGSAQGESQILFSDGTGGTIEAVIAGAEDWTDEFIVTTVPSGTEDGPVSIVTDLGTSNEVIFNVTEAAAFSPSTINWTLTTSLPTSVSGHQANYVPIEDQAGLTNQFVYVTGGRDSVDSTLNQLIYGNINTDGTISSWNESTSLPTPVAFHNVIAATPFNSKVKGSGYLYVIGGVDDNGDVMNAVSVGSLNEDGTLAGWNSSISLPEPLHSLGAAIFRSTIYIAGGATTGNVPVDKVYKAEIDTLGNLSDWEMLTSLPSARAYHGFTLFGAFLYSVGGESDSVTPDDGNYQNNDTKLTEVAYAKIDLRSGDITDAGWTINENSLQKSRSKHTGLAVGGNLFVSSGLYAAAGQGSSENTFAQIFSDGTVDAFGGATGSNTLLSEGKSNLFNQAGLSFIDADGTAHVMIIGGDDVNFPGTKVSNVLFY